jgi:hypothetical protein
MCIKSHNIDSPLDMTNPSGIYMFIAERREMAILHEIHVHLYKCSRHEHKSVYIDLLNKKNTKLWLKNAPNEPWREGPRCWNHPSWYTDTRGLFIFNIVIILLIIVMCLQEQCYKQHYFNNIFLPGGMYAKQTSQVHTATVAEVPGDRKRGRHRVTPKTMRHYCTSGQTRLSHCRHRFTTATSTAHATVGRHGRHISSQTVINRLKESGLRSRRTYAGLVLTRRHHQQHLRWAHQHVGWTRADWANVLFTDKSRFNLWLSDGRARVYRRRHERFHDACVVKKDQLVGGGLLWSGLASLYTRRPMQ